MEEIRQINKPGNFVEELNRLICNLLNREIVKSLNR